MGSVFEQVRRVEADAKALLLDDECLARAGSGQGRCRRCGCPRRD